MIMQHEKLKDTLSAMSFNLWCGNPKKDDRFEYAVKVVRKAMPDVFGVQEATPLWLELLTDGLSDLYNVVGFGRDSVMNEDYTLAENKGEGTFVFYLKDKFELLENNTFWLSPTPTVARSMYEGQGWLRVVTWVRLRRKADGKEFVHCNTHLDFNREGYPDIQNKQVEQILNYMKPYQEEGLPVLITGDFNLQEADRAYQLFAPAGFVTSRAIAESLGDNLGTFPNPRPEDGGIYIDFLMCNDKWKVKYYTVVTEGSEVQRVSDHYPVYMEASI